jgi:hypothetical protein
LPVLTHAAAATLSAVDGAGAAVLSRAELAAMGCSRSEIRARLAAARWRQVGKAVVLHNGELTREQRWRVGVINCGPRAMLASFSAAEYLGLTGWERHEIHVLAPAGVGRPVIPGLPIILHRQRKLGADERFGTHNCQRIAPALVLAAGSFASPRPACGLLAAGVQQRLTSAADLRSAVVARSRTRHHAALLAAVNDIAMGAEALSEIDFVRLCRRHGLPPPTLQAVRRQRNGLRRYLDAEWQLDGRRVAVEVDGAVHLAPRRWFDDQLRQNELALSGTLILRYPSVVVRTEPQLVVSQLRRALGI